MFFGNIKQKDDITHLEAPFLVCLQYVKTHDLSVMEPGIHEIDGKRIYVNICVYETRPVEERNWEAHRRYIDLQYMVEGEERIDFSLLRHVRPAPYREEADILTAEGDADGSVILREGDFVICRPSDVHRPGIAVQAPRAARKAAFKIQI